MSNIQNAYKYLPIRYHMKYAQASLEAVGQFSFWVFTLCVTGHIFRNEKKHKACGREGDERQD